MTYILESASRSTRIRQQTSPLQSQMFQLHALHQIPARQVAERLGVKLSEVYFAKYKLAAQIRREVQALEESLS